MLTNLKLSDWALACTGQLIGVDAVIDDISTDTRSINKGESLFQSLCFQQSL